MLVNNGGRRRSEFSPIVQHSCLNCNRQLSRVTIDQQTSNKYDVKPTASGATCRVYLELDVECFKKVKLYAQQTVYERVRLDIAYEIR
jgi:hypothetical protein